MLCQSAMMRGQPPQSIRPSQARASPSCSPCPELAPAACATRSPPISPPLAVSLDDLSEASEMEVKRPWAKYRKTSGDMGPCRVPEGKLCLPCFNVFRALGWRVHFLVCCSILLWGLRGPCQTANHPLKRTSASWPFEFEFEALRPVPLFSD